MQLANARTCFEALAKHGPEPALRGVTGVWEFELEGASEKDRTWSIRVDDARVTVGNQKIDGGPRARFLMREADFVRLALGSDRENIVTALLRGALKVEGDLRFAQQIQALLPMQEPEGKKGTP